MSVLTNIHHDANRKVLTIEFNRQKVVTNEDKVKVRFNEPWIEILT